MSAFCGCWTARPEAACPTPVSTDDVDWETGRNFVTVDLDGCGSEFRVEVPHGSPMELDELFRLLNDPQPPDASDLLMADSFLWNDVVPDVVPDVVSEAVPPPVLEPVPVPAPAVPAPAPAAVLPPQVQRRQGRPSEASSSIQQLLQLAPYVELAADSVILKQLAAAMHSRRRNAAGRRQADRARHPQVAIKGDGVAGHVTRSCRVQPDDAIVGGVARDVRPGVAGHCR